MFDIPFNTAQKKGPLTKERPMRVSHVFAFKAVLMDPTALGAITKEKRPFWTELFCCPILFKGLFRGSYPCFKGTYRGLFRGSYPFR